MTTVRGTEYEGGVFCLPEYGLKIPVQPGDVLIALTAREWHCNLTPVRGTKYSIVCYYQWRLTNPKMRRTFKKKLIKERVKKLRETKKPNLPL